MKRAGLGLIGGLLIVATGVGQLGVSRAQEAVANDGGSGGEPPRVERELGEEEQILQRHEWFYSSRRAGTVSASERATLRHDGVTQTRLALERQMVRREAGLEDSYNVWVSKGPSPSTFGGWSFGNVAGRISSIAADWAGEVLYLGTASGGLWKSTNDGLSWTQMFDSAGTMTIGTVAVDPSDPAVIWAGTGENNQGCESYFGIGLMRSADAGVTWEPRNGSGDNTLEEMASFANVSIDPRDSGNIVTGGRHRGCDDGSAVSGGIYTSTDAGLNWTRRLNSVEVYEIARDPVVLDVLWSATSQGVYKSTNNGVNWAKQTASGLPSSNVGRSELAIAPSDGNVVYALFSGGPSFWRTTDGGATWTQMTSGSNACDGQCWYNMVLRVHRTDPNIVIRGTVHIFRSIDGGSTWTDLSNGWGSNQKVHQDMHHLLMHPQHTEKWYAGGDGGIWKTENGGSTFSNLNGNLNITQFYAVGVRYGDTETICGGAQDNSSLVRTNDDTWDLQSVTGDGFVCHFNPLDGDIAYITSYPNGGYPNVRRSTSGAFGPFSGITGSSNGIISGERINWVTPYTIDPVTPNTLYLGTQRVYRSDNYGGNWTATSPSDMTGGSGNLKVVEVNRVHPSVVYAGTSSGRVWRTVNGATDWTNITTGLPSRSINDIAGDPDNEDRAFAVVGGFNTDHLWEWNAGSGWTARSGGLPNVPANTVLMLDGNDILVGTDTGIFRSFDGGLSFQPYMDGLPQGLVVTDLKFNPQQNIVTAGTYGRGAWQVAVGPPTPRLLYDSIEQPPVEINGDGDDRIEPGETWGVRVMLTNAGGETALDASAKLATVAPGVTFIDETLAFGDIASGDTVTSAGTAVFVVAPSFTCGEPIGFDVFEINSANPPVDHDEAPGAFTLTVLDSREAAPVTTLLDESFDPSPSASWSHEAAGPGAGGCTGLPYLDQWKVLSKDAAHGESYHLGNGEGSSYTKLNHAWLYHGGKDSESGAGILIPDNAVVASLTLTHWYETTAGIDGGQVVIDAVDDGQDVYTLLEPVGGYPWSELGTGNCNALGGMEAFQGSSGGWTTSTFDLLAYKGGRVHLAFVFGSDRTPTGGEGWYIDQVTVETHETGAPICQVADWPGMVPATARYELIAPGTVEASWSASCNVATAPDQAYAIQAGDLDLLHAGGGYSHVPVEDRCDLASPSSFTPGAGNEYYLVLPNLDGREGGAGADSHGAARPLSAAACGLYREAVCP